MPRKKAAPALSPARRAGRLVYRTTVVLAAIIVVLYCGLKLAAKKPGTADDLRPVPPSVPEQQAVGDGTPDTPALQRRADTFTFLLAAADQAGGNADTIMVAMYDTVNQTLGMVSVPRDTLVKEGKINALYAKGVTTLRDKVSETLGIPIDHYVAVNMKGLARLVDELGGIDFNVPVRMAYDDPTQNLHIHYEKGMQRLSGADVVNVARCRKNSDGPGQYPNNIYDTYPDADIGRTRTQQQLLSTILKKALSNPGKVGSYVKIFKEYVDTDLSAGEILWFAEPGLGFDFSSGLSSDTLPGDGNTSYRGWGQWCYQLYPQETLEIVNRLINPYTTPREAEDLNIFQVN